MQGIFNLAFQNIKIRGLKKIDRTKSYLIVCNHLGTFDFFMTNEVLRRKGYLGNCKYILKDGLFYIPLIGPGMYFGAHCFLSRNLEKDKMRLKDWYRKIFFMDRIVTVLYPEGTRITPRRKIDAELYCEINGLQKMKHTLYPRKKGFNFIRNELPHLFTKIISLSFSIEKNENPNIFHVFFGPVITRQIYIDIDVYENTKELDIADIFYKINKNIDSHMK